MTIMPVLHRKNRSPTYFTLISSLEIEESLPHLNLSGDQEKPTNFHYLRTFQAMA